jgi:hypothetical protein
MPHEKHLMKISVIVASCVLSGCMTAGMSSSVVEAAAGEEAIFSDGLTCTKPYLLEQDCSDWVRATRKVMVGNRRVAVAGSKDGTIVLVMEEDTASTVLARQIYLNNPARNEAANEDYRVVRAYFDSKSVSVKRVRPVRTPARIDGYILELGSDGYSLLKELTLP